MLAVAVASLADVVRLLCLRVANIAVWFLGDCSSQTECSTPFGSVVGGEAVDCCSMLSGVVVIISVLFRRWRVGGLPTSVARYTALHRYVMLLRVALSSFVSFAFLLRVVLREVRNADLRFQTQPPEVRHRAADNVPVVRDQQGVPP